MCKVSVLMPIFNAENYLAEAIDSVIFQSYQDWELIIINDGSTDRSDQIIRTYNDKRIKYFKNAENKGITYTRNLMIERAKGEYIAFLDSDDLAHRERLKEQVSFLDKNRDYAMCGTWAYMIDNSGNVLKKMNLTHGSQEIKSTLLFSNSFVQSSVMIRSSILAEMPYDISFPVSEDYELWTRVVEKYKVENIPQHLTYYRWHDSNISKTKKDLLDSTAKKIYQKGLSHIGLIANKEELEIQFGIQNNDEALIDNKEYLCKLRMWMKKLHKANNNVRYYDISSFNAIICFRWIFACKERKMLSKMLQLPIIPSLKSAITLTRLLWQRL